MRDFQTCMKIWFDKGQSDGNDNLPFGKIIDNVIILFQYPVCIDENVRLEDLM